MIPSTIAGRFTAAVRNRGRDYVHDRRVHLLHRDDTRVLAHVRGRTGYDVTLRLDPETGELLGACTCPHVRDGMACKHLWSVLLELDRSGFPRRAQTFALDALALDADEQRRFRDAAAFSARFGAPRQPAWFELLDAAHEEPQPPPPSFQQLWYAIGPLPDGGRALGVNVLVRDRKTNGEWGKPRAGSFVTPAGPPDTTIIGVLRGAAYYHPGAGSPSQFQLSAEEWPALLPLMCRTGRCTLASHGGALGAPLVWDDGAPWSLELGAQSSADGATLNLSASLTRGIERRPLSSVELLLAGGLVVWPTSAATFDDHGAFRWAALLADRDTLSVPTSDLDRLMRELARTPRALTLTLPPTLAVQHRVGAPAPHLRVRGGDARTATSEYLRASVAFGYDDVVVEAADPGHAVWSAATRTLTERDRAAERRAVDDLIAQGFRAVGDLRVDAPLDVRARDLPRLVRELTASGWRVEAEGRLQRQARSTSMAIRSGIDWFELHGSVDFDGYDVSLAEVWRALSKGETTITLGDGSVGLLPEEWLSQQGIVAALTDPHDDHLRFTRSQIGLVDAWLSTQPPVDSDDAFQRARAALREVEHLAPLDPASSFFGVLRPYQRDGLGWLAFLVRCGCGGCLADDMGLGKTVQVLAHLDARRAHERPAAPSLVVVPRSLVFNWMDEAARFTPRLRVVDHTSAARPRAPEAFEGADVVLVTYGTLRRDIGWLKDVTFDHVVLDEAQAIKNASSESAKVARLLKAKHRLALSGTPVQNHLGELWSLFEFLNPGMLGVSHAFSRTVGRRGADEETREALARAIRPFVLRRTKEAVAPELPARVEQIVHCAMDTSQRKLYDKLLTHVRSSVGARVASDGLSRARMHVLEALLRLRQVACHPGLVDVAHASAGSAKLDVLYDRLDEILQEGHRALVFSQFTSLLAYVRQELDARGIRYGYLDGRTRDRDARVKAFQTDERMGVFLVSLKAGGLGLNLTGADYVFLLDPWWNPAIEAQAIDRAHRIGQTRPVMAYRLIARDSVEEKILQLQDQKRALSASIVPSDDGLVKQLTEADLEFLFG